MTKLDLRAASSMLVMIVSSVGSSITVSVSGFPGSLAQMDTGRFGSASMTVTLLPDSASSLASSTAEVDFPAPPLGDAKTMTEMGLLLGRGCGIAWVILLTVFHTVNICNKL